MYGSCEVTVQEFLDQKWKNEAEKGAHLAFVVVVESIHMLCLPSHGWFGAVNSCMHTVPLGKTDPIYTMTDGKAAEVLIKADSGKRHQSERWYRRSALSRLDQGTCRGSEETWNPLPG